jgi:nucleotide-binding universal stress UspA family protein
MRLVDDEVLRRALGLAGHYRVETRTAIRHGVSVEDGIVAQMRRGRHDLVVLGVRAHAGEALSFGGVAAEVIAQSTGSVMLIAG